MPAQIDGFVVVQLLRSLGGSNLVRMSTAQRSEMQLDIERIVPQHGAIFADPQTSAQFIDWVDQLPGAAQLMKDVYRIPK